MFTRSPWVSRFVALLVLLVGLLALSSPTPQSGEAAQATLPAGASAPRDAGRAGHSPTLLRDSNNNGLVDILDYGVWRQNFGASNCGNPADLNGTCLVDILDYGVWRQNFGQTGPTLTPTATVTPTPTATPALPGRAYV